MSADPQDRWQRHMDDEARAIDAQQARAGDDHAPVRGTLPHGDFASDAVARGAAAQAREECARMVEALVRAHRQAGSASVPTDEVERLAAAMRA